MLSKEQEFIDSVNSETITGQVNITFNLKQTLGQFMEIQLDTSEDYIFDEDEFLEYVRNNVIEILTLELTSYKEVHLNIDLLTRSGQRLNTEEEGEYHA